MGYKCFIERPRVGAGTLSAMESTRRSGAGALGAYRPEPVDRARRVARPRPMGAEPPPDEPVALSRAWAGSARAAEACRRRSADEARIARRLWSSARLRSRTTRCGGGPARRRSPPTSSYSPPTPAVWSATGGRGCTDRGGARGCQPRPRGALRRPHPPRSSGAGEGGTGARLRGLGSHLPRLTGGGSVLSREDAVRAVTGERFDVIVVGGGATGAGVALDAASRGYTVALVERDGPMRWAPRAAPRRWSGGCPLPAELRSRPRPRGAARAPADGPARTAPRLPDPVPGADPGKRQPDGRDRAQHVRRDVDHPGMSAPRARLAGDDYWAPDFAIGRSPAGGRRADPSARRPRSGEAYLFYDCQTDDARLVLTILGEAERYGAVCINEAEVEACSTATAAPQASPASTPSPARGSRWRRTT